MPQLGEEQAVIALGRSWRKGTPRRDWSPRESGTFKLVNNIVSELLLMLFRVTQECTESLVYMVRKDDR